MATTEQSLISFFILAAQKKKKLMSQLEQNSSFEITPLQWSFTLLSLFTFLQSHNDLFSHLSYKQFKQLIYNSSINKSVKEYHAEIIIHDNQDNIDHSTYGLVWQVMK